MSIPPEPLENWDTSNAGPLTGIFAVEATITAHAGPEVKLKQLLRLRIVQQGSTFVHEKTTLCAFKLPVVPDTATLSIPPALQAVIQTKGAEEQGDFLSGSGTLKYTPPPFLVVVGAKLASPATDPLPTQMDLASAIDEDMDGNPGVTLGAEVFTCGNPPPPEKLFVAIRTSGTLVGQVPSPDLITGKVDVKFADSVLGFSNECLSAAAMLRIDVTPGSPFKAIRTSADDDVDHNGNVSCPELVLRASTLFPDWDEM